MRLIIALGAAACLFSAYRLPLAQLDLRFLLLSVITVGFSSRLTIQVPRAKVHFAFSDTFIFLTLLLYGGEAAVLLAAAEALFSCMQFGKKEITIKTITILFNAAVLACSTFLTAWTLRLCFKSIEDLPRHGYTSTFFIALCMMALVQYIANTGLASIFTSLKTNEPLWHTWSTHYLWSSVTSLAGAAAAGMMVKLAGQVDLYVIVAAVLIIGIVYFTYRRYIEDVKESAAQAERSERARAEQAERHVEELSHYVAELERTGKELGHYVAELERTGKELHESKEHFRHAAFHDSLTGLPNRAFLTEKLKSAIERAEQQAGYKFAVLFLDLDRFKNINDSLGHTIGDQLLITIARRLENSVREMDTVARLGGDEFAILLEGIKTSSDPIYMAERVQKELTSPFLLSGHEVFTTTSIGIALSSTGYDHPEDILRDADTAMYRAKESGKACYEVFDKDMHARAVNLLRLETDLRRAIEREEFLVYYQPIVSLESGLLIGFEALARWQHPERGFISPTEFISAAEDTRLIIPLGLWVLREACRQMAQWHWQSPANRSLILSVNLSGKQFTQPDLVERIKQILDETHLDPNCLKLEITESVVMENAEAAISMLVRMKALGVRLSIDDFGTGYSSLSYLHRFPVDTLKIDRSFVNQISVSGENAEIVRTIKTLASNLGMDVVAEGVETLEQMRRLEELECEYGQGYLFSQPLERDAAEVLIERRPRWRLGLFSATNESLNRAHDNVAHIRFA
jgi:diguanylate cyclase (GGDEF)-like protein